MSTPIPYAKWSSYKKAIRTLVGHEDTNRLLSLDDYLTYMTLTEMEELQTSGKMADHSFTSLSAHIFETVNRIAPSYFKARGVKIRQLTKPTNHQYALIYCAIERVGMIYDPDNALADSGRLGVYCPEDGHVGRGLKGLYYTDRKVIRGLLMTQCKVSQKEAEDILATIEALAPNIGLCKDSALVAVKNGIFNFDLKILMEFNPLMCFTSKSSVNFNPNAKDTAIVADDGYVFTIEEWIKDIAVDDEVAELIWEIIGACVRPTVPWNRTAFFYSTVGNNGKGSICALIRHLLGPGAWCSLAISEFSRNFATSVLVDKQAIITDENDVGTYIDKSAAFKAVVTGDTIFVDVKHQSPIPYRFNGFMIQCINDLPRTKDKTGSFYRRQLLVPFLKSFTGKERKYIKDDYLKRTEVLEYVLYRVLMMDYYELSTPEACKVSLDEYKIINDPLMDFWTQVRDQLVWDRIPLLYLYDLYQGWYKTNYKSADSISSRRTFKTNLMNIIAQDDDFTWKERVRFTKTLCYPEPLSSRYHLTDWQDASYSGPDVFMKCKPNVRLLSDRDTCVDRSTPKFGQPLIDVYEDEFLNSAYYQTNQDIIGKPIVIK